MAIVILVLGLLALIILPVFKLLEAVVSLIRDVLLLVLKGIGGLISLISK